jgi:hypothetical protein
VTNRALSGVAFGMKKPGEIHSVGWLTGMMTPERIAIFKILLAPRCSEQDRA